MLHLAIGKTMEQIFCKYHYCSEPLKSAEEIVNGYCTRHMEQILSDDNFVGICWQCGEITLIQTRKFQKDFKIKDKYIFAEGCKRCTRDEHKGIMWMTINLNSQPVSAVTPMGKIEPYNVSGHSMVDGKTNQAIVANA